MDDTVFYSLFGMGILIPLAVVGAVAIGVIYLLRQIHLHQWSKWKLLTGEHQYRKCETCGKTEIGWTY